MDITLYQKYKDSRDLAWIVLIENKITNFPVGIGSLIAKHNIKLIPSDKANRTLTKLKPLKEKETYSIKLYGNYYIIYNKSPANILRFATAHELGHILLNHIKEENTLTQTSQYDENQANIFASRLLSPAIIAKHNNITTAEQISSFFGISQTAAEIRAKRINELLIRNKFLTSPLEKKYYKMYLKTKK